MRALIVDDSSFIREYLRHLLSRMDIVCEEAVDGSDALTILAAEETFDLMLLDVNMPVMDGVKAAEEIRRISPETKIVFLTMFDTPVIMQAAQMWSNAFVSKYKAGSELIPTLNRLIQGAKHPLTLSPRNRPSVAWPPFLWTSHGLRHDQSPGTGKAV